MKVYWTRDYKPRHPYQIGACGFSTGIFYSFFEPVKYLHFQVHRIGQLAFYWGK